MDAPWEDSGWEHLAADVGRRRLPGWDATVGLVAGTDAALLYDTGSTLREGREIRIAAEALLGGRRVTHIALSHPHFDHVLGTAVFAGVQVYGAVGLDGLLARNSRGAEVLRHDAVRHGVPASQAAEAVAHLVAPHHMVSGELTLDLGGRQVVLADCGPGHTGHDLALYVPGSPGVVFCGDLVEESGEPQAGPDAFPAQWPAALDRLLALGGEDARYVPGHGAVVDAAFVRAQRDVLAARSGVS
ncbi:MULTISPECIES: MBL fold metallo-hydrolase [unclassified Streptomyces]|uniref:MBL fold metallo-hydrolase n=1 Tax=unclassified Streptomyces TaxID=2593676 RepID=UPI00224E2BDE|nr:MULTISPECIES: MBL fold metallo-hydrolase [unclassified Streptomyces]MCX4551159.1 MBL fold metallo-hydrolase [Streptomyces sp. NBC_01500]WSC22559.1 MBL fold metallo-hydrolase [Streptomyces sp. NBC_01766]WSV56402.1 MBL fold metallo-hydrolase [Streptomyces sp. NBC_01014]